MVEVADHDFTCMKFSLIPSVSFVVDISEDVSGSWYSGQVLIGLKEGAFELSLPLRHVTELHDVLHENNLIYDKSVLFLYCDGGRPQANIFLCNESLLSLSAE